ncbi:DUF3019 domain-containing protein [Thalassotalea sp. Y01]|uniref:DUF3019 domain-containing protein n=1 Tax=Thalassotalea sp. Y01 TaxID=2729613 RepID=UPI00145E9741|nr:DUF3019 domain-containing protein [Thalassotalea sp. Y01]NMP14959.1 DUF3019 domain-containing protein [Thalassotalea sp. Y01]
MSLGLSITTTYRTTLLFSAVLVSHVAKAKSPEFIQAELTLTPSVCVMAAEQGNCQKQITMSLIGQLPERFCVFVEHQPQTRQCYVKHQAKQFNFPMVTEKTATILVEDTTRSLIIARALFKVATYVGKRKKRRYGWSIF